MTRSGAEASRQRRGLFDIVHVRLDTLRAAIIRRDWNDVEFQFDRVRRAVEKAERTK